VVVLQVNLTLVLVPLFQVMVQATPVDLVVVLDFTIPELVELHLVLLSLALLAILQILVGDMMVVEVDKMVFQEIQSIMLQAAVVPEVLDKLVEMEQTPLEEKVDLVTCFHLTSKCQHQLWHLPHMEIQDRVVVLTG
tara:strand:+ start:88 stop:498 length:411 start_codon:yes stop_codon:yes gene_type:complete